MLSALIKPNAQNEYGKKGTSVMLHKGA